jgi:hypothetical protein
VGPRMTNMVRVESYFQPPSQRLIVIKASSQNECVISDSLVTDCGTT